MPLNLSQQQEQYFRENFQLSYHIPYLDICSQKISLNGLDVLEIGGALPLKHLPTTKSSAKPINFIETLQKSKDFYRLASNTAITTATLKTLAIKRMLQYLKPGGKLFTMHSPIWSAFDGHHLPIGVPKRSLTSKIDSIALSPKK